MNLSEMVPAMPLLSKEIAHAPKKSLAIPVLEDILDIVREIGFFHPHIVEIAIAAYISKDLTKKNPIWLMMVGEPSSNKTELVGLLRQAKDAYTLDTMTANPFISGAPEKERPHDLLPLLKDKCLIVKDYTSLFGMSEETVKKVISELVAIYDGEYSKHSSSRGTISYETTFSHIGCITPSGLNMRQRYMNMVGARFLTLRMPHLTDKEKEDSFKVAWNKDRKDAADFAADMTVLFADSICQSLRERGSQVAEFSEDVRNELNILAEFTASARGEVRLKEATFENEEEGKIVHFYELQELQIERPFRALHQLRLLAESLAIIRGKGEVGKSELNTVREVALSSMPVHRAEVLSVFKTRSPITANEVKDMLDKSYGSVKRCLDELVYLNVLVVDKGMTPYQYQPHSSFASLICPTEEVL